jgi:bifunctional non-homologous end joining protein LigD
LLVRREGPRVRCFTRGGYDWADRFPAIVEAARSLRAQSFLIDGEVIVCRPDRLSDFDALRYRCDGYRATLVAFDLIHPCKTMIFAMSRSSSASSGFPK